MKSFMASPSTIERKWYVVDAEGQTLGRLSSQIASVLRGKNKPTYTPNADTGDYVIVINAEKVKVTGRKLDQKIYYHHSDYVGGMKETTLKEMLEKHRKDNRYLDALKRLDKMQGRTAIYEVIERPDLLDVQEYDFFYAAVGWHPHDAASWNDESADLLRRWAKHPKVRAIGEIGLDYHYDKDWKERQFEVLEAQMCLAEELDLPVVIHDREFFLFHNMKNNVKHSIHFLYLSKLTYLLE